MLRKFPITFLLTSAALRCTMPSVPRKPGPFNPMKRLQSLLSALGILALGFLIVATIVWLIVDAILGGAL